MFRAGDFPDVYRSSFTAEESVPIWQVISSILPREYAPAILRGRLGFMFVVQRHDA